VGEDGVLEMAAKDANSIIGILHLVGFENTGLVQKSMADGNAREDDFGSDLQLPWDVLVVLHEGWVLSQQFFRHELRHREPGPRMGA
jgi:hypothetical protein